MEKINNRLKKNLIVKISMIKGVLYIIGWFYTNNQKRSILF